MMSTILLMAAGFGLGLWYAKGKPNPARQLWRDARACGKKVCTAVKEAVQEARADGEKQ